MDSRKSKHFKSPNAFTLVEVLVVLGIVAVLMALGGFAASSAQNFGRNQDRTNKAGEIAGKVNDYLRSNGRLPSESSGTFEWSPNQVRIGTAAVDLPGILKYDTSSTSLKRTAYLFVKEFGDYQVCVQQEDGTWDGIGSGIDLCP